jgi:hypothetical protein
MLILVRELKIYVAAQSRHNYGAGIVLLGRPLYRLSKAILAREMAFPGVFRKPISIRLSQRHEAKPAPKL